MQLRLALFTLLVASSLAIPVTSSTNAVSADRIWFCPAPGTLDYLRLFEHPEEWAPRDGPSSPSSSSTRNIPRPRRASIVGPEHVRRARASGRVQKTDLVEDQDALEAGSVKEFWCTPDASGMDASIRSTLDAVKAIEDAGGTLAYLAMDEPGFRPRERVRRAALEPTADRVAHSTCPRSSRGLSRGSKSA